jgi:hypothetical protein
MAVLQGKPVMGILVETEGTSMSKLLTIKCLCRERWSGGKSVDVNKCTYLQLLENLRQPDDA